MGRLCFRWNMLLKQSNWAPLPSGSRHRKGWVNVLHFASWSIFVHQGDPCHKKMSTKVILDIKIVPQGDPGGWKENHLATDGTNLHRWVETLITTIGNTPTSDKMFLIVNNLQNPSLPQRRLWRLILTLRVPSLGSPPTAKLSLTGLTIVTNLVLQRHLHNSCDVH